MAMALRPWESPTSMASRYGAQALDEGLRPGRNSSEAARFASESVITSMAGFGAESVNTSLAGFAGEARPQPPGGRIAMPASSR